MLRAFEQDADGTTAASRVFSVLSGAIVRGELAEGARINEPALAAQLGISRAPLREAIRRLEERRLVVHVAHQGVRVVRLGATEVSELYRVRAVLEAQAAREAASRLSSAESQGLLALLDEHAGRIDSDNAYLQGEDDDDFHSRIIRGSGNALLMSLLLDEFYLVLRMLRGRVRRHGHQARRALLEHRRIAEALQERDGDLAAMLMQRHIEAAHDRLLAAEPAAQRTKT